ncbi:hypothetical protein GobsT_62710 [Gemmata obscuriglobus]|uniref:STAS domain-containing protein n=1 Tax=Gemmata obscuriglobus TaxID=114 RepID=A0A2Z3H2Z8_9BACT|nr:hypothetical protein [Gemmata obscuriglobus]AWM35984.1 hypothetical protein C1280_02470 [Gemmata obscuriglobus]QEG31449.1 hypothetical protein GobsT_62710 [Gemmata obscuriglobus]VTS10791.1 unnamed protein product [Gemmata obscuriglobus UQM 2246]
MPEPPSNVFVLRGRVGVPELLHATREALLALQTDPRCQPALDCSGVTSFTGEALLLLTWVCQQLREAGATLRLLDMPQVVLETIADRLIEATVPPELQHHVKTAMSGKTEEHRWRWRDDFSNN